VFVALAGVDHMQLLADAIAAAGGFRFSGSEAAYAESLRLRLKIPFGST
jgi:hypothetical protein